MHAVIQCPSSYLAVDVMILVDNRSLEELERESAEAERRVDEAKQLAIQLKRRVAYARNASGE